MLINDDHLEKYLDRFFKKMMPLLGVVNWRSYHILYGDDAVSRTYIIYYNAYCTTDNTHWSLKKDIKQIHITAKKLAEIIETE